jgi:hypothetical protein
VYNITIKTNILRKTKMTTKRAAIRNLAIANVLLTLMSTVYGVFLLGGTVAAQTQEPALTQETAQTQDTTQTQGTEESQETQEPGQTKPDSIPSKIETLTATGGNLSAILSWEEPAEKVTSYSVEYGILAGGVYDQICTTDDCVDALPGAIIRDLQQDTVYMFRITPSNALGTGESSNEDNLTITGPCSNMGNQQFCGQQVISAPVLRFTNIPTSFDFTTIVQPIPETEATPEIEATPEPEILSIADYGKAALINPNIPGTGTFPPIDVSSSAQDVYNNANPATQPALEDLLGVQDTRDSGGFEAQVQTSGTFTNGVETIPLSNLYVATNVSSPVYSVPATDPAFSCPATDCGVIYGTTVAQRGILSPADSFGNGLGMPWTYTTDFGSGAIVLMDGGLPASQGRNGYVYQFLNYHLHVPAYQAPGDYAVILTYTLIDDTL